MRQKRFERQCESRHTLLQHKRKSLLNTTESREIEDTVFDDKSMNFYLLFEKSMFCTRLNSMIWPQHKVKFLISMIVLLKTL